MSYCKAPSPVIYDKRCLEYCAPGHPERPERVSETAALLEREKFAFVKPPPADDSDILLSHSGELLETVRRGGFYEPDTPAHENIYEIALLSAGGAIRAAELAKDSKNSFSLMRPPGHHATRDNLMGFCYFNNITIAALKVFKGKKVAVIDFDCHHGNGTEDILRGRKNFLYVSLHQSPGYPGTGLVSSGNIMNFPLPPGTGGGAYLGALGRALRGVEEFNPDYIGVSAGFDSYRGDPLMAMALDEGDFGKIGAMIKGLGKPVFSVLEGGYSPDLPRLVLAYLSGLDS